MTERITGTHLIEWGFKPAPWFKEALAHANELQATGSDVDAIRAAMETFAPAPVVEQALRTNGIPFNIFLEAETEIERENLNGVISAMDALMRTPTVVAGAVMPDAMPAGVIPVGGVVATENAIHPGFHSADICCSVAMSVFKREVDLKQLMDAAERVTHFGPGKRARTSAHQSRELRFLLAQFEENRFLRNLEGQAEKHFMTQGDGNHFLYVGRVKSSGLLAVVTHHGSRGLGAQLYKRGMEVAKRHKAIHAPRVPDQAAWIEAESENGRAYWEALQITRNWTKLNHFAIHDAIASAIGVKVVDRMWNEHNFVFQKSDGLFYHGKGATPNWRGFSGDDDGRTLIPLNMAEPILVTEHVDFAGSLGFAPHGAGRNMSRTRFLREYRPELPQGIDVRFWCGRPDLSELPDAYKNAASVRAQIEKFGLARVVDEIEPLGSIMAGDWEADAPWRKRRS